MTLRLEEKGGKWIAAKRNIIMKVSVVRITHSQGHILIKFRFVCSKFCNKSWHTALLRENRKSALWLLGEYNEPEAFFLALDTKLKEVIPTN
jgi:hypothetical protein